MCDIASLKSTLKHLSGFRAVPSRDLVTNSHCKVDRCSGWASCLISIRMWDTVFARKTPLLFIFITREAGYTASISGPHSGTSVLSLFYFLIVKFLTDTLDYNHSYTVILFIKPTLFNDFNHVGQLLCDFASPRLSKDNWSFFKMSCWWPIGGR